VLLRIRDRLGALALVEQIDLVDDEEELVA
jgi:hypothetical protein